MPAQHRLTAILPTPIAPWLCVVLCLLLPASGHASTPHCGALLTDNTRLDANMDCTGTALFLEGQNSSNITLNCAGHIISSDDAAAIVATRVKRVTIKNCQISTDGYRAAGILLADNSRYNQLKNNAVSTTGRASAGIELRQSRDNELSGNVIETQGMDSAGIRLRASSQSNRVDNNHLHSAAGYAIEIESSSYNRMLGNRLSSSTGYLRHRAMPLQAGGLSVDASGNIHAVENADGSISSGLGDETTFFQVDPNTGEQTSTLPLVGLNGLYLLGFDALEILDDGRVFALAACCYPHTLYEIDPVHGDVSQVALSLPSISGRPNGLESDGGSSLLATTEHGELISIHSVSGVATLIGSQEIAWRDLAIHPTTGDAYALSRWQDEPSQTSHLYTIDLTNGQVFGEIGDTGQIEISGIDFAPDATLYGNRDGALVTIDIGDASVTQPGGRFGLDPGEPVPEANRLKNTRLENDHGSVEFDGVISLPDWIETDLSAEAIDIGDNRVRIDSAAIPFLDRPATLELNNLAGDYRVPLVDPENDDSYQPCDSPQCKFNSFFDGKLVFEVSGFSSYGSEENSSPDIEFIARTVQAQIKTLQRHSDTTGKQKKRLKEAGQQISAALDYLDADKLKKALGVFQNAVKSLDSIDTAQAEAQVDHLVEAARKEAQAAIDHALATGGPSTFVSAAEAQMAIALALADDRSDKAIQAYTQAWKQAQKGTRYRIGGRLKGLTGSYIKLQQSGGDALVLEDNGAFSFDGLLGSGEKYRVSIQQLPFSPPHDCKIGKARGTVATSDIDSVLVKCTAVPTSLIYVGINGPFLSQQFHFNSANGEVVEITPPTPLRGRALSTVIEPGGRFVYQYIEIPLPSPDYDGSTISSFRINPYSGALEPTGDTEVLPGLLGPITVDPSGRFVYRNRREWIDSYRIDPENGTLTWVDSITTPDPYVQEIEVDPSGRFLYAVTTGANYLDTSVILYHVDAQTGTLTEAAYNKSSAENSTYIAMHPTMRFAYLSNLDWGVGWRQITIHAIDPVTGILNEIGKNGITQSGDFRMAVDPSGRFLFSANYQQGEMVAYRIDPVSGQLSEINRLPSADDEPVYVSVDPTGRFLLVINGGYGGIGNATEHYLESYAIDPQTGALSATGFQLLVEAIPQQIAIQPPEPFVYVANAEADSIGIYKSDRGTGALSEVGSAPAGSGPLSVTVSRGGRFAYATNVADNSVSSYAIHPKNGGLVSTGEVATGTSPLSVTVDPSGRFAYVSNVGSNDVTTFSIDAGSGELTEVGSEVAAGDAPNALSVEPTGRFAYVANVLSNDVTSFSIDQGSGALSEIGSEVAAGTAPRAVKVHPSGRFAYVVNQASHDITSFSIDIETGELSEIGSEVASGGDTPKAMTIHPGGLFAYVANEVSDDVTAFGIDPASGALTQLGAPVAAGDGPRSITVDSTGRFAYVVNFDANTVLRYAIDPATGELSKKGKEVKTGAGPHSIAIIAGSN